MILVALTQLIAIFAVVILGAVAAAVFYIRGKKRDSERSEP